jgi:predicted lipoprotein with Yx(FWY)xxD motif
MLIYLKNNLLALLCLALVFSASCKKKSPAEKEKKGIQLAQDAKFGAVLTDNSGKTLYFFASDVAGTPTCTGGCETLWPLYYSADLSTDMNVNAADVGEVTRSDGRKQSTYKGYPLYYYQKDAAAGETTGDGVGGIWFVAKPDYSLMLANAQLIGPTGKLYTSTYVEGPGNTKYFTDAAGRTLYAYAPDKNNKNTFTKADLSNNAVWPVYEGELKSLPSVITKDLISVIDVFGKRQLTYKGWPLYYYGQDTSRGQNKGITVGPTPGSVWPVLTLTSTVAPAI